MEILLASDLHYALPHFDWILDQAPTVDAVILAGDLLDIASTVPLESQIVVIRTYLRRLADATVTITCSGNHDLTSRNRHDEKAAPWIAAAAEDGVIVDGMRLDLDGLRITVCPWWDGPATRQEVDEQLRADAHDLPARWLWVYHYPPDESPVSWTGRRHIGDTDLNRWIEQHAPDLVLTGHIHDSPFRDGGSWSALVGETWVINAGRQKGPIPTHAIIDTAAGRAEWWSPYGQDHQVLWPAEPDQ